MTISYDNFAIRTSTNSLVTPLPKTPNDLAGSDVQFLAESTDSALIDADSEEENLL